MEIIKSLSLLEIKKVIMDIKSMKIEVVQKILSVSKPSLLEKISQILDQEMIVGYTVTGAPLTLKEYNDRLIKSEEEIKNGDFISQEDLEKESESW